ncbi:MAG: LytTR family DNA-binding domain-containing protein [Ideonella sp.]
MTTSARQQPFKVLVADDDATAKRRLVRSLGALHPDLMIIEADNGIDAWDRYLEFEPDLCFLDVRMPGLTGIEVARRIAGRSPVVFLSAPNDRALSVLEAGSVLHLVKPLQAARIAEVFARAQAVLPARQPPLSPSLRQLLDLLAGQLRRPAPLEAIETGDSPRSEWLMVEDVVYLEAEAHGTRVVSQHGEVVVRTPLKELVAQLDTHRFTQINRFAVVNQRHIQDTRRLDADTMVLSLRERLKTLPVSRHFQALFDNGLAGLANG